ncbi:phage baseplate assembly protein V [Fusobacterium necrophorum]|uniref:Phage baseplate assembly protein V n=1 Tax=Fusobacterium necrophorum TaxID=859 RepID=A0A4Q2KU07_9FUSO|nr:phage baseplate assembly protein V [Fusobacterium necrophorum]RXZ69005.1 phage baseplate assembly protein V [Fusobacterium necrophorum]
MIRYGKVSSIFPEKGTVKVIFEDLEIPSAEIPVLMGRSEQTKNYSLPKIGESGICIFPENSFFGFYLGAGYDKATPIPSGAGEGVDITVYADGTIIKYDENKSELYIDCKKAIKIIATEIEISSPKIKITGDVDIDGIVNVTKDVVAKGVSLTTHIHSGISPGDSKTGGPE